MDTKNLLMMGAAVLIGIFIAGYLPCPLRSAENADASALSPATAPNAAQATAPDAVGAAATASGVYVTPVTAVLPGSAAGEAPNFSWLGADGSYRELAQYRGKVVMVNFWATWCPPCRAEMPAIVSVRNELAADGFEVIGVAVGERPPAGTTAEAHVAAFATARDVTYPMVTGNQEIADAFGGITAIPTSIIIGRDGRIVETIRGARDEAGFRAAILRAME